MTATDSTQLNTTPAPMGPDGISPDLYTTHIAEGPEWLGARWLGWTRNLDGYEYLTADGPAVYEPVPPEQAGRTWATTIVGIFRHPKTDARLAFAWRYYR